MIKLPCISFAGCVYESHTGKPACARAVPQHFTGVAKLGTQVEPGCFKDVRLETVCMFCHCLDMLLYLLSMSPGALNEGQASSVMQCKLKPAFRSAETAVIGIGKAFKPCFLQLTMLLQLTDSELKWYNIDNSPAAGA